jgi:hypothetical protein
VYSGEPKEGSDYNVPADGAIFYISMPVANIPLDRAYLTAIWLETLFYGDIYFDYHAICYLFSLFSLHLRDEHCFVLLIPFYLPVQAETT